MQRKESMHQTTEILLDEVEQTRSVEQRKKR